MTWVGIVLWVITHAPQMIAIIRQIIDLIKGLPKAEADAVKGQIASAIQSGDHNNLGKVLQDRFDHLRELRRD